MTTAHSSTEPTSRYVLNMKNQMVKSVDCAVIELPGAGGPFGRRAAALRAAAAAGLVFLVAGCAPDLGVRPQIQSPERYATEKTLAAGTAPWPQEDWWRGYGDPQLDALMAEALKDAPDLKIAAARLRAAEASSGMARANLWPTLGAQAGIQETEQSLNLGYPETLKPYLPHGWHHAGEISAGLNYQLDFFGKNRASLAAATSLAEAARAEEASARLQLSCAVADVYAGLMQLFAERALAEDALRIQRASLDLIARRFHKGLENEAPLHQAEAAVATAEGEAAQLERLIATARNRLAALLGQGPDRGLAIVAAGRGARLVSAGLPDSVAAELLGRRPDIVAAKLNARAAAAAIDVANANFYPNIDLTGMFGVQSLDAKALLQSGSEFGKFGPAVTLPLFDYGRLSGAYRKTRADYDAAVAVYDRTLTNALREVADAYADLRGLKTELAKAEKALAAREGALRVAEARYKAGVTRYLEELAAEAAAVSQRRSVADLQAQMFAADISLIRALGGGYAVKDRPTRISGDDLIR
jgi:NodT family efflux transporter outer membrane factor (OMF) lipoprotein